MVGHTAGSRPAMRLRAALVAGACAIALPLAGLMATARTASASAVGSVCAGSATWSFSSPLTLGFTGGTITATYSNECEEAGYFNDFGTSVTQDTVGTGWTNTYPYTGSCTVASFAYGYNYNTGSYQGSGLLIGGTVAVATSGNSNYSTAEVVEVDELAALIPCSETSALGSSQSTFVGTF